MKKINFISCLLMLIGFTAGGQEITGKWEGALKVSGISLRFVLNLGKSGNAYQSTFDSPDQNIAGIPASETRVVKDSIFATIASMKAQFTGKWDSKDMIMGVLSQGGMDMPITFQRHSEVKPVFAVRNRPQTPKPPFAYDSEEVEYDNADKSVHYGATLTKPRNKKDFPTVIIISGSGSQDRDGTMFGHKLYAVVADHLANQGIGVLRVDDRGTGKSTVGNDPGSLTSAVFEKDIETSLNYLLSRNDINKNTIGLIGHSEGGIIAPMVAARRKEISFLVLWGAPSIGGLTINVEQNAYQLKNAGIDSLAVEAFKQLHRRELSLFATTKKEDLDNAVNLQFAAWKQQQDARVLRALYVTETGIVGQNINEIYHSLYDVAWMRFFIGYDPATDLSKVKCRVLAINGSKDTQVDAAANLPLIYSVLTKSGNKNVKVMPLASLNHLLQTAKTGDASEYETIEETISPMALTTISNWINNRD